MIPALAMTELSQLIAGTTIGAVVLGLVAGSLLLFRFLKNLLLKSKQQNDDIVDFVAALHGLTEQELALLETTARIARIKPAYRLFISRRIFDHALRVPAVRGKVSTNLLAEIREKLFTPRPNGDRFFPPEALRNTTVPT